MRIHLLQCECRWRRVRQLHQAMNHTLGTDRLGGEMRSWSRNSIGYKVCEYPPRLYHCSPCYDIDDWTVLSICVASLRLFPYHHTYTAATALRVTISTTGLYYPPALLLCHCFPIITLRLPPRILHLSQSLRSFAVTTFHNFLISMM
jgi:hypothetical protein